VIGGTFKLGFWCVDNVLFLDMGVSCAGLFGMREFTQVRTYLLWPFCIYMGSFNERATKKNTIMSLHH
jgi:hypothetical protein